MSIRNEDKPKNRIGGGASRENKKHRKFAIAGILAALAVIICAGIAVITPAVAADSTTNTGGFSMANVISSVKMFYGCGVLEGQNGTAYSGNVTDADGAVVDKDGQPGYLSVSTKTAFAIYCEDDGSLTFYNQIVDGIEAGGTYRGKTVTAIYTGFDTAEYSSSVSVPWYDQRENITSVIFKDETAPVSTAYWFYGCSSLETLDLSKLDTSSVTSMANMFYYCSGLTALDLSSFDTSSVTDMAYMFSWCSSLTALDLSSFDTSSVTSMRSMFYVCPSLTSLDLSSFDTSSVTNMMYMFYYCSSLTSLDLSSFDTSSVTNMMGMFSWCSSLTTIYANSNKWSTASVTDSSNMFSNCMSIMGGNGTTYDSSYTDASYACIDKDGQKGYLTEN